MEVIPFCLTIVFLLGFAIYAFFTWSFSYWKRKGVYSQKTTFLFGNAKDMITQKSSLGVELQNAYNHFKAKSLDFGGYYFLSKPILVPVNLDLIKKILITDFDHFTDHTLFVQDYDPVSRSLFALKGGEWKALRTKLSPAFTAPKNKLYFETVLSCLDELPNVLDEAAARGQKIDVKLLASRISIDVISSCAFGVEANSIKDPNSEIRKGALKFFEPSFRNAILLLFGVIAPQILSFFKMKFIQQEVSNFFVNIIEQTVNYREANKVTRPDFLQLLLQIKNTGKITEEGLGSFGLMGSAPQMTIMEMAAHSINFVIGGFESSSSAIMYCLYELAKNEDIQDKAREDVQNSFSEHAEDNKFTYAVVQNLSYLEKVIFETMRKYPSAPMHLRECSKDYKIPNTNVTIDKGCGILIPTLGIHRDPEIYPNPDEFNPDRFLPENVKGRHQCAWSPFGLGPRSCIGYQFSLMAIKIVIATVLNRYRISVNSETNQPLKMSPKAMLLMPDQEIWVNFERI